MGRIMTRGHSIRFASAELSVVTLGALFVFASCSDGLIEEQRRIIMEANQPIVTPPDGRTITAHETITFVFPKTMDPAAVSVSGTLGTFTPAWETRTLANDTMILNGAGDISWTAGTEQTLDVTVNTGGEEIVYSVIYGVFRGMCVSKADPFPDDGILPDDSGQGTALQPLVSIPVGITKAQTKYGNCSIHVAAETYGTDWNANAASRIIMAEGVSLIGGYAVGWQAQNATLYQTSIIDSSAAGGAALNDQNCAVSIGAGITAATVLEGFRIFGGLGGYSSAVIISDASPIIRNCSIQAGGDGPDVFRYGVFIAGTSSPVIQGCRINEAVLRYLLLYRYNRLPDFFK
jgi:hypothetical protein